MDVIGSSPRVRGTLYANVLPRGLALVHPRVCGELSIVNDDYEDTIGSSPRVRGTRGGRAGASAAWRFIPACAGNS